MKKMHKTVNFNNYSQHWSLSLHSYSVLVGSSLYLAWAVSGRGMIDYWYVLRETISKDFKDVNWCTVVGKDQVSSL